jgi:hypothetical protein
MKLGMRSLIAVALLIAACGGGSGDSGGNPRLGTPTGTNADISMLFMGNSHASVNNLQGMVVEMVRAARPAKSVGAIEAPGWMFLEERLHDAPSVNLLRSQDWSFVILQAQKYSSSGQFQYSTAEAEEFIRIARQQHAVPVMFPEWPRLGIDETMRIYDLHVSIAQREVACVAPIGQAWDLSLARHLRSPCTRLTAITPIRPAHSSRRWSCSRRSRATHRSSCRRYRSSAATPRHKRCCAKLRRKPCRSGRRGHGVRRTPCRDRGVGSQEPKQENPLRVESTRSARARCRFGSR